MLRRRRGGDNRGVADTVKKLAGEKDKSAKKKDTSNVVDTGQEKCAQCWIRE